MVPRLFDGAVEQLARGLGFAARRHQVLTENLANLETPGYKAKDLAFDDYLRPLLDVRPADGAVDTLVVGGRTARVVLTPDGGTKADGNDVHLDRQMARLAQNSLFHSALTQMLATQLNALKQAISGRV